MLAAKREAAFRALKDAGEVTAAPCPISREMIGIPEDITPSGRTVALLGMTRVWAPAGKALSGGDAKRPFELALVLDELEQPEMLDGKTFVGGHTRGRLYLWSDEDEAIVCAANVAAQSEREMTYRSTGFGRPGENEMRLGAGAHLLGALMVDTIDRGLYALRVVQPAKPKQPTKPRRP